MHVNKTPAVSSDAGGSAGDRRSYLSIYFHFTEWQLINQQPNRSCVVVRSVKRDLLLWAAVCTDQVKHVETRCPVVVLQRGLMRV